jgi:hypothetical protein
MNKETFVLKGTTFGSTLTVTVELDRGSLYKGLAERVAWRAAWVMANAINGKGWWDHYELDREASTIGDPPNKV